MDNTMAEQAIVYSGDNLPRLRNVVKQLTRTGVSLSGESFLGGSKSNSSAGRTSE
jgi:hypothetical protein